MSQCSRRAEKGEAEYSELKAEVQFNLSNAREHLCSLPLYTEGTIFGQFLTLGLEEEMIFMAPPSNNARKGHKEMSKVIRANTWQRWGGSGVTPAHHRVIFHFCSEQRELL